jgi:hypothetical protein
MVSYIYCKVQNKKLTEITENVRVERKNKYLVTFIGGYENVSVILIVDVASANTADCVATEQLLPNEVIVWWISISRLKHTCIFNL